jgi:thiol:disulfide interchange protein DsbD
MKISALLCFFFIFFQTQAQKLHPVKWKFSVEEKKAGEAELIFHVTMDKGWHIYSQYTSDGGPLPMLFSFDSLSCYSLLGKVIEPAPIEEYDSLFEVKVMYLKGNIVLKQKVKYSGNSCKITGNVSYQACKEACIALDTTFTFKLGNGKKDKSEIPTESPVHGRNDFNGTPSESGTREEFSTAFFFINSSR